MSRGPKIVTFPSQVKNLKLDLVKCTGGFSGKKGPVSSGFKGAPPAGSVWSLGIAGSGQGMICRSGDRDLGLPDFFRVQAPGFWFRGLATSVCG